MDAYSISKLNSDGQTVYLTNQDLWSENQGRALIVYDRKDADQLASDYDGTVVRTYIW